MLRSGQCGSPSVVSSPAGRIWLLVVLMALIPCFCVGLWLMAEGMERIQRDDLAPWERVMAAESFVDGVESLPPVEWERLRTHRARVEVCDQWLTCKALVDFRVFQAYVVYFGQMKHYDPVLHLGPMGARHYRSSGMGEFIETWHKAMKGIVVNRWNCKTQEAMAWYVWLLGRDPNERMMLRSHTDPKVHEIVRGVRDLLLMERFQRRFPWVRPAMEKKQRKLWSNDALLLERDITGIRTATIEAYGVKASPTGGHYTLRAYDDWETEQSANSGELLPKLFDTFQLDSNLCEAGSKTLVIGTPYVRSGFIDSMVRRIGPFEGVDYDLFYQPATVQVFPEPFLGQEPVLGDDRMTLECGNAGFPVGADTLEHCQARVMFFSTAAKDTVSEIREVVWNDERSFRVNRPFDAVLGQPLSFRVLPHKPAAPTRFTLDSEDWTPPRKQMRTRIARTSLPRKRQEQGSYIYSCQQDLHPIDPGAQLYNDAMIHWVEPDELPGEPTMRRWYQTVDLAGKKKTECYSSILLGYHFWTPDGSGVCVTNLTWGNLSINEAIFHIFLGALRTRRVYHSELDWTSFEAAAREEVLRDNLATAENEPRAYFEMAGGKLATLARQEFEPGHRMLLRKKHLSRGSTSKGLRFLSIQPMVERGELYVVKGIAHEDRLREEFNTATRETTEGFDIMDTLADLIREGRSPMAKVAQTPPPQEGMYGRIQRNAILQNTLRDVGRGGWRS